MSLINDALKRARSEALRQEAEGGRAHYRAVPAHSRRSSRSWLVFAGPPVVTAIVVFGMMVFWPRPSNQPDNALPAVFEPVEEESMVVSSEEETSAEAPVAEPSPAPVYVEPVGREEPAAPVGFSIPLEEPTPEPTRGAAGEPTQREDRSRPSRRAESNNQAGRLEEGATYRRLATAADGSTVELGGIAYSETSPIAVINGSVVSPGDMIAGFTVVAIDAKHVELEVDGVRIYLSLR